MDLARGPGIRVGPGGFQPPRAPRAQPLLSESEGRRTTKHGCSSHAYITNRGKTTQEVECSDKVLPELWSADGCGSRGLSEVRFQDGRAASGRGSGEEEPEYRSRRFHPPWPRRDL